MINHARKRQHDLVITLIDLRNTFGEVHHSLLRRVLDFHHIPHELRELILEMYRDFYVTIGTMGYTTCPIKLERGVLQGDCLSPLLFNFCFNTLIQTVKQRKVNCLGYVFDYTLQPRNWLQFADDTVIATSCIQDNQYLLNLFTKWSVWANFVVRVDKCKSFGITKKSVQFEPNLVICREKIPEVESNKSFEQSNFEMRINEVQEELEKRVISYLTVIDKLPLHPKSKIQILTIYVFSKIRWTLTIYEFPITWLKQKLDSSILYYIRRWLKFHPGANTMHLTLPLNQLGAGVTLISELFQQCLLSKRTLLKGSNSADVRKLYYLSAEKHVEISQTLEEYTDFFNAPPQARKKNVSKAQEKKRQISVWNQFMGLKEQSLLIKEILDICQPKTTLQ